MKKGGENVNNEIFKQTQVLREEWSMEHYGKHENELTLDKMKELDQQYPCWGLATSKCHELIEVSLGGTRARMANNKKELKVFYIPKRYPYIIINNYVQKTRNFQWVHQLVADAFVINDNPEIKTDINHIDGNNWNNAFWNLEWCTKSYNMQEAKRLGLVHHPVGGNCGWAKYTDDQVTQICQLLTDHPDWTMQKIADTVGGVPKHLVRGIWAGETRMDVVSKYYPFPARQTKCEGDKHGGAKFSAEQVEKVCCILDDIYLGRMKKISHPNIAALCGVSTSVVNSIAEGCGWTVISSKHPFYKAKFGDQAELGSNDS